MSNYMGSEWSPSEWYQYNASPTVKRLIRNHIDGHHTKYCMIYDFNYYGYYCKWLDKVFWPRIHFNTAIERARSIHE